MEPTLLLILIVIGNLCIYWILFGKKKFEQKLVSEVEDGRTKISR